MPNEILSSVRGRITKLALVYSGDTNQKAYFEYFASNLSVNGNNPSRFKVIIFMGMESFENDLLSSGYFAIEANKSTFKPVQDASLINPTRWIRDPFVQLIRKNGGENILIETDTCEQDPASRLIAEKVAAEIMAENISLGIFPFDGGNILADEGVVFVGANQFFDWASRSGIKGGATKAELLEKASHNFVKLLDLPKTTKVIVIGDFWDSGGTLKMIGRQDFNIGLFSPSLWFNKRILRKSKQSDCQVNGKRKEEFPHIDLFLTLTGEGGVVLLGEVNIISFGEPNSATINRASKVNAYLDAVEAQLSGNNNIQVKRMPLPLIFDANEPTEWFFCFYNNCLVENSNTFKRVWLPHLSASASLSKFADTLKGVEAEISSLWSSLGFDNIMWVPNELFRDDMEAKGAIHCVTKELERE